MTRDSNELNKLINDVLTCLIVNETRVIDIATVVAPTAFDFVAMCFYKIYMEEI